MTDGLLLFQDGKQTINVFGFFFGGIYQQGFHAEP
jgi:hypothetical protein